MKRYIVLCFGVILASLFLISCKEQDPSADLFEFDIEVTDLSEFTVLVTYTGRKSITVYHESEGITFTIYDKSSNHITGFARNVTESIYGSTTYKRGQTVKHSYDLQYWEDEFISGDKYLIEIGYNYSLIKDNFDYANWEVITKNISFEMP